MGCSCIVVDDESVAIQVLKKHIEQIPQLNLIGVCKNSIEALDFLSDQNVELIFLDIQMPKINGIDFLKTLTDPPKIIFTSAYRHFAVEAFELNAIDFLLKPINFERFLKAVNKVLTVHDTVDDYPSFRFGYFRVDRKMIKVHFDDILYIESFRDYITIHLEEGKELRMKLSLNHVEEMLPASDFLRIHRSFLVSIHKISAFTKTDVEIGKKELPIGKSYTASFRKLTPNVLNLPSGVAERL